MSFLCRQLGLRLRIRLHLLVVLNTEIVRLGVHLEEIVRPLNLELANSESRIFLHIELFQPMLFVLCRLSCRHLAEVVPKILKGFE